MKDVLAIVGFIILYFLWLISPIVMIFAYTNDNDIMTRLAGTVYIGGALVIASIFVKFIGIW